MKYKSRQEAGKLMADFIREENQALWNLITNNKSVFFCFAIPNGGIPVAEGFCEQLNIKYDFIIVRKIKIPWNTEAGFGSITTDGTILLNESLYKRLNLSEEQLNFSIELTKKEITERLILYEKDKMKDEGYKKKIENKNIFMIDDGLASGFTMLAAIKMIKKFNPNQVYIAVPTAPSSTVKIIKEEVENIFCPDIKDVWRFAVAEAYQNWYDVPESEVLEIIQKSRYYFN